MTLSSFLETAHGRSDLTLRTPFINIPMPLSPDWSGAVAGYAILGGSLLGVAASFNLYMTGRITGISGIFGRLLNAAPDWRWRAAFLAGLLVVGVVAQLRIMF